MPEPFAPLESAGRSQQNCHTGFTSGQDISRSSGPLQAGWRPGMAAAAAVISAATRRTRARSFI